MRADRILIALTALVIVAAAIVAGVKTVRSGGAEAPEAAAPVAPGSGNASLLVIGIQGLEPKVMNRLIEEGRLPNLAGLIARGATGTYSTLGRNVDPRITWTSLVTGMLPENQGVGGKRISRRGELVDAPLAPFARTVGTLWTFLSDSGRTCAVLGWPGTWPVEELNGIMVGPYSTYVLERKHNGKPEEAVSPVAERPRLDPLIVDRDKFARRDLVEFVNTDSRLGLEALVGENYEVLATACAADGSMVDVASAVSDDPGVDGLFVCLTGVDIVSQRFWHYMETEAIDRLDVDEDERRFLNGQVEALGGTVERYYEHADELVGRLLGLAGDGATVAVVADHGYSGIPFDASGLPKVGVHMHSEEGVFIIAGPGVAAGATAEHGRLIDVAPTIAAAAGIEFKGTPDGHAHTEILRT